MEEIKSGRPAHYNSPEELWNNILEYFETAKSENVPVTITGLCIYLGFESRQSFYDIEKRDGFSYIIKKARLRIENRYEIGLSDGNVTGSIFALKNMGWSDKMETITRNVHYNVEMSKEEIKEINDILEDEC